MRTLLFAFAMMALAACGDDGPAATDAHVIDAGVVDSPLPTDAADSDASCFNNPQNHVEIINACTTADKIYKSPTLPLLLPDGGLPPIP
jgi:hypothetical protein